jgi:hypothetical protein
MQPSARDAVVYRLIAETESEELSPSDHPVLLGSQPPRLASQLLSRY